MRRFIGATLGLLVAWLLGVGSAAAALPSPPGPSLDAHNSMWTSANPSTNYAERGPPVAEPHYFSTTHHAVVHWTHGVSVRPKVATTVSTYDYEATAQLAQIDNNAAAARAAGLVPASLQPFGVAANAGRTLSWSRATINQGGVSAVERHLARFESGPGETAMLQRLRAISRGELDPTDYDLRFYTHELRESVLYRKVGYPSGQPTGSDAAYDLWDRLHTQALTDYGLTRSGAPMDLFHPSVRP